MATYTLLTTGPETYAVPVDATVEAAALGELTQVPGARREILGVRNLRRQLLAVADLAQILGIQEAAPQRLLVVAAQEATAGFAVSDVLGVSELPDPAASEESSFLAGTIVSGAGLIGVIDVPAVFRWLQETVP